MGSVRICITALFLLGIIGLSHGEDELHERLKVEGIVLCESVEEREPVSVKTEFTSDVGKVYCWTNIYGAVKPTQIKHVWYYGDKKLAEVPLSIKYPRMRTWSCKSIIPEWVGDWYVEIIGPEGDVLKRVEFIVGSQDEIKAGEKAKEEEVELTSELDLKVEIKFGTGVEQREILGEENKFPASVGRVYCWNLVEGTEEPTTITHVWYYGKKKKAEVPLNIKYPRTRTWSYKTMLPEWTGQWEVRVIDSQGGLLKKSSFKIVPDEE